MKKFGFTLAEVLITLGIIGVVAALTLPTLIQHHRKSVIETRLAKFYSVMNQAIQRAEVDYGDKINWPEMTSGYEENEAGELDRDRPKSLAWFNKYLKPYLQISDNIEIFGGNNMGRIKVYFNDGSAMLFGADGIEFFPDSKKIKSKTNEANGKLVVDQQFSGKDYFIFRYEPKNNTIYNKFHYKKGIEPYLWNWDGSEEMLKTDSDFGCKTEGSTYGRAYCTKLIQMNGWKIPDDYPFKF